MMKRLTLATLTMAAFGFALPVSAQQPSATEGKALFEANCKSCHGARGIPTQAMVKMMKVPRLDSAYYATHTDDAVVEVLKKGKGTMMKSYSDRLTPEQMLAVARYMRSLAAAPGS